MLVSQGDYIFLEKEEKISKAGVPFFLVHFADVKNYVRLEYFADPNIQISVGVGGKCKFTLKAEKRGYQTQHSCISVVGA